MSVEGFPSLRFPAILEDAFEAGTRVARSHRMALESLVAILGYNACLLFEYAVVKDHAWHVILRHTMCSTPLALLCNWVVRRNPPRWLRESTVGFCLLAICWFNLFVEGNADTACTLLGATNVLITALFVGVVMRLRFLYAVSSIAIMAFGGQWLLLRSPALSPSEKAVSGTTMLIGLGLVLMASYSLEREERRNYLFHLQREMEAEELGSANEKLQRLSGVDPLTGLPNRRSFEDRVLQLWKESARTGSPVSVVLIDVDNFKIVNDVFGHLYGDEVLRRIGLLLPQALRSPEDLAARFGGEEFVLLLPNTPAENAMIAAERARLLLEKVGTPPKPMVSNAPLMWTTVSCGVSACIPAEGLTFTMLLAAADEALYAAKRGGRNRVECRVCSEPSEEINLPANDLRIS